MHRKWATELRGTHSFFERFFSFRFDFGFFADGNLPFESNLFVIYLFESDNNFFSSFFRWNNPIIQFKGNIMVWILFEAIQLNFYCILIYDLVSHAKHESEKQSYYKSPRWIMKNQTVVVSHVVSIELTYISSKTILRKIAGARLRKINFFVWPKKSTASNRIESKSFNDTQRFVHVILTLQLSPSSSSVLNANKNKLLSVVCT